MVDTLIDKETIDKEMIQQLFKSVPKVKLIGTGSSMKIVSF